MEFHRNTRRIRELMLTPLIDVVFILIVFFMLTSTFMKNESLELMLPSAGGVAPDDRARIARVFIHDDGALSFGGRRLDITELNSVLKTIFSENAEQRVVVFSSPRVSMQRLVDVMDMVRIAGGRSLFVREWRRADQAAAAQPVQLSGDSAPQPVQ